MQKILNPIILAVFTLNVALAFSQERTTDSLDAGTVNVVKPYTPKISDAFKIKETPSLNDATTANKKAIVYNIFSIPVASTFTPAKGKAATVDREKSDKLYDNYASLGLGTYTTLLGEVYLNHELSNTERVGGYLSHHSSAGDIDGVNFDNNFAETGLKAHYSQTLRDYAWKLEGGFQLQTFNWYGLPDQSIPTFDVDHSFYTAELGGNINFEEGILNNGSVLYRRFGDDLNSGENRFILKTGFNTLVTNELIKTEVTLDYIGGTFDQLYLLNESYNYGNFNVGLAPSYQITKDDLSVNLGLKLVYLNDTEASASDFFVYPNISANYRVVDELMIAYGGISGGLTQNSYQDFAQENPFIAPGFFITPTDQAYHVSLGIQGKLTTSLSYDLSGSYQSENNKPLFKLNPDLGINRESYQYGNSFGAVYDDVTTFSIAGELNFELNRNFKLGLKGEYFAYDTNNEAEAWNLPDLNASVFLDYQIDEHWSAGANVFFVGERQDIITTGFGAIPNPVLTRVTLDGFFDANAHVGYKINDQLSAFAKANNIANQDYQRWLNYPVQSIQFLIGATYQFDF